MPRVAPWLKLARLIAKHDPTTAEREGPHYCFACGDLMHIGDGLDPSALCNTCAQDWAHRFATILDNLHRPKKRR